jgi:hypothetical protein
MLHLLSSVFRNAPDRRPRLGPPRCEPPGLFRPGRGPEFCVVNCVVTLPSLPMSEGLAWCRCFIAAFFYTGECDPECAQFCAHHQTLPIDTE